jgi:hypothetical protein
VGAHIPGNTGASVYVPAAGVESDTVYVDGEPVAAEWDRGYLRIDAVTSGCHRCSANVSACQRGRAGDELRGEQNLLVPVVGVARLVEE